MYVILGQKIVLWRSLMSRSRGRRYDDDSRQLNMKKVIATIIVIIGIIMIVLSIKNLL